MQKADSNAVVQNSRENSHSEQVMSQTCESVSTQNLVFAHGEGRDETTNWLFVAAGHANCHLVDSSICNNAELTE